MLGRTVRLVGAALALALTLGSAPSPVRAADELGGYTLAAHASALRLVLDSDALPVPAHPVIDATIPETSSSLESGPLGHGLASFFWPGDLAGHFGSAVQQLSQLCTTLLPIAIPNVPPQCLPIPQALKDNAPSLNDPFKAETFVPGGPLDVDYFTPPIPGVTMSSHASENKVESLAGLAFGAPGVGTAGWMQSRSTTRRAGATATSDASSELFNVALAGGLVTIDHIVSTAKETTDGVHAAGTGSTVVSGLRIGGVPATIDETGLRVGALSGLANQALRDLGLEISVSVPEVSSDGAKGSFAAPVLVVSYRDDQNALEQAAIALGQKLTTGALRQVTGSLQQLALGPQAKLAMSLGGASAAVDGAPSFTSPPGPGSVDTPGAEASSIRIEAGTSGTSGAAVEGTTFVAPSPHTAALPAARTAAVPRGIAGPLGGWGGLAWGLVLLALLAAIPFAYGLYRYGLAVDTTPPPAQH